MMAPQQQNSQSYKNRQAGFLSGLARVMIQRNTPLPPAITGVQVLYDPATSRWKHLEPSSEVGSIRIAGRDVELFRLWQVVVQAGGVGKMQQQSSWASLLPHFDLPERLPYPQSDGNTSTAIALAMIYRDLISPFESFLMQEQQRQAIINQHTGGAQTGRASLPFPGQPGQSGAANVAPGGLHDPLSGTNSVASYATPHTPQSRPVAGGSHMMTPPSSAGGMHAQSSISSEFTSHPFTPSHSELDLDAEARKRKLLDSDDPSGKRSRRRTGDKPLLYIAFARGSDINPTLPRL